VIRFDAANPPVDVDSRCAPAHNLHKPSNHNKQKRTIDVLPNPDNLISYRQAEFGGYKSLERGDEMKGIGLQPA